MYFEMDCFVLFLSNMHTKYWIVRLLKIYKEKQCDATVSFPQFSLWLSASSSHAPDWYPCHLLPMLTARPMLSGVEDGIRAPEARPPHTHRRKQEGLPFRQPLAGLLVESWVS